MKRLLSLWLTILLAMSVSAAAAQSPGYPDGIYRGFYYEGGIEQIAIEFTLQNNVFTSILYHGIKYKDGDYMAEDASDAQKAALRQYRQLADYLVGKEIDAIDALYMPYEIVEDLDAVTSATMQSSKLIAALWDGLNRRPYQLLSTSVLPAVGSYPDGVYRGCFMEDGEEQIAVEFSLRDNCFVSVAFRSLRYHGEDYLAEPLTDEQAQLAGQFASLSGYLCGKPVSSINDLYLPGSIVQDTDAFSGATLRAPKVISAIWDGLNRRPFRLE